MTIAFSIPAAHLVREIFSSLYTLVYSAWYYHYQPTLYTIFHDTEKKKKLTFMGLEL